MIKELGSRATAAIGVVLAVCLGVRIGAWLIGPLLPVLMGVGVVYAVALCLVRRR